MTAGQLLRLREAMGKNVQELAELLGVEPTTVYRWERGERHVANRRVKELLRAMWDEHLGPPMTRDKARREIAARLRTDLDNASRLLVQYHRAPGEPWRDVVSRVVDGERFRKGEKVRRRA